MRTSIVLSRQFLRVQSIGRLLLAKVIRADEALDLVNQVRADMGLSPLDEINFDACQLTWVASQDWITPEEDY